MVLDVRMSAHRRWYQMGKRNIGEDNKSAESSVRVGVVTLPTSEVRYFPQMRVLAPFHLQQELPK